VDGVERWVKDRDVRGATTFASESPHPCAAAPRLLVALREWMLGRVGLHDRDHNPAWTMARLRWTGEHRAQLSLNFPPINNSMPPRLCLPVGRVPQHTKHLTSDVRPQGKPGHNATLHGEALSLADEKTGEGTTSFKSRPDNLKRPAKRLILSSQRACYDVTTR
jgi:hypothetical protein